MELTVPIIFGVQRKGTKVFHVHIKVAKHFNQVGPKYVVLIRDFCDHNIKHAR
jgi:hypothetical protein